MSCAASLADEVFSKTLGFSLKGQVPISSEKDIPDDVLGIQSIVNDLIPFIKESLLKNYLVLSINGKKLSDIINIKAVQFLPEYKSFEKSVVICRAIAFNNYNPIIVEKALFTMNPYLIMNHGIAVSRNTEPLLGGFENLSKYKNKRRMCTIRFYLANKDMK